MEELKSSTQNLKTHVSEYVNTYVQLAKAKVTQGTSDAASGAAIGISAFFFGLFFLFFAFCALAFWLGDVLDSRAGGFLIVAAFFLTIIIVIFALKKKVIVPMIRNTIISKVYE